MNPANAAGRARSRTIMAALVDTNVLVYRYDPRYPEKQRTATDLKAKYSERVVLNSRTLPARCPAGATLRTCGKVTIENRSSIRRRPPSSGQAELAIIFLYNNDS